MPWIPMYLAPADATNLLTMLDADEQIAFLLGDGPTRWRAYRCLPSPITGRIAMWHIPSGPLPLLGAEMRGTTRQVPDPFSGWMERRTGADPTTPYFGAGHPGIIWLNLRLSPKEQGSSGGLSSFEWIGNHYAAIGNPASAVTQAWWKSLRQRIQKSTRRVARQRFSTTAEIFAYPEALKLLENGLSFDNNP
jgi:hypothetical protein